MTAIMTMMMTTTNDGERQSKIRIAIIAGVGRALARPALLFGRALRRCGTAWRESSACRRLKFAAGEPKIVSARCTRIRQRCLFVCNRAPHGSPAVAFRKRDH